MTTIRRFVVVGAAIAGLATGVVQMGAVQATEYASSLDAFIGERAMEDQRERAAQLITLELAGSGIDSRMQAYRVPNPSIAQDLILPPIEGVNVVADIAATQETSRNIIVGAHYDTKAGSPGADDNASGTYAAIEVARRIAAMPSRNANVIFVWFDQEEVGLVGSRAFAARWKATGRDLHSMHNIDMIGYDGNDDGRFDLDVRDAELENLYLEEADKLGIPIARDDFGNSDHESFLELGFRAACLSEDFSNGDINPGYHLQRDRQIDQEYMMSGVDLVTQVLKRILTE